MFCWLRLDSVLYTGSVGRHTQVSTYDPELQVRRMGESLYGLLWVTSQHVGLLFQSDYNLTCVTVEDVTFADILFQSKF